MNSDRNDPGTNIIDVVIYYWKRSWSWLTPTLGRIWARLIKFAAADPARELADLDRPPDITAHRMGSLIIKALPFMRPMLPHILFMFILGFVFAAVYTVTGAITGDVWLNKILNGEKLQPFQAFVFILDDSYVKPELVDGYEASEANAAEDEAASQLTKDQRRVVRNRSFAWFVIGSIVGIPMGLILPYYGAWIWQNVNHYLRVEMVNRLEYLSLGFHHSNRAGGRHFSHLSGQCSDRKCAQSGRDRTCPNPAGLVHRHDLHHDFRPVANRGRPVDLHSDGAVDCLVDAAHTQAFSNQSRLEQPFDFAGSGDFCSSQACEGKQIREIHARALR